jgi:hypothetical protein
MATTPLVAHYGRDSCGSYIHIYIHILHVYNVYIHVYIHIYIYILVLMFPNICPIFMLVDGLSFQLVNSAALAEVISQSSVGSATSKCRRRSTMWGDELTPCYGIIPLVYWYTTGISSGKCVFLLLFVKNIPDH